MLTIKSKPKQYLVELQGGKFTFSAPTDRQEIEILEALGSKTFSALVPILKNLLLEVSDVVDQDQKPIPVERIKSDNVLGGALTFSLIQAFFDELKRSREVEEKNAQASMLSA